LWDYGRKIDEFRYTREEIFDKYEIKYNRIKPKVEDGKIGFVNESGDKITEYIYDYIDIEMCMRL